MGFLLYTLITLFIVICFMLIMLILIQKGRGGGLASAFGGGGGGNTAFGAKTGDVLTWVTSIVFGVFLLLAILLNLLSNYTQSHYKPRGPISAVAPVSEPTPPAETVPPLTTDSRPTTVTPPAPVAGKNSLPAAVTAAPTSQPK